MSELRLVSFNGADGAGKSTLARGLFDIMGGDAHGVHMIANLDYRAWATPEQADHYDELMDIVDDFGNGPRTIPRIGTFEERESGCNAIFRFMSRDLYLAATRIVEDGGSVIIHSDPLLKGIVWANLEGQPPRTEPWDNILADSLIKPDAVVHVTPHPYPRTEEAAQILLNRLVQRGELDSADPKCLTDVQRRLDAAENTARHVERQHRLAVTTVINTCVEQAEVTSNANNLAGMILDKLNMHNGGAEMPVPHIPVPIKVYNPENAHA